MQSLWRRLALAWLGGEASAALTGDGTLLDTLLYGPGGGEAEIYRVTREPAASPRALQPAGERISGRQKSNELKVVFESKSDQRQPHLCHYAANDRK